jgi:N-acetyl-anhydromuramyl-L-alanine amidase AmpD
MGYAVKNDRLFDGETAIPFVRSPNQSGRITPTLIVVHDTAAWLTKGNAVKYFKKRLARVSAHFVVDRDGTITQMVECDRKAWHAGKSSYNGRKNCNAFSIGIEIVSPGKLVRKGGKDPVAWFGQTFPDDENNIVDVKTKAHGSGAWLEYTPEQIKSVEKICSALVDAYPIRDIVAHWEISPRRKIDTNPVFPLEDLRHKTLDFAKFERFPIGIGDHGDDVFAIQNRLVRLGYGSIVKKPDGHFGPLTKRAVIAWQSENDIDLDGELSEDEFNQLVNRKSKEMASGEVEDRKKSLRNEAAAAGVGTTLAVGVNTLPDADLESVWSVLMAGLTRAGELATKITSTGMSLNPTAAAYVVAGVLTYSVVRWWMRRGEG